MVSKKVGKPRKVIKSILEGDEGPKEFSDFGFIASNPDRQFLLLPIEIKLPAAMGKAPGQMAEFVPRLQKANKIIRPDLSRAADPLEQHIAIYQPNPRRWIGKTDTITFRTKPPADWL
jgi:hypothetical protein